MIIFLIIMALWITIRTISYGIFEIRECKNTLGGIVIIGLSIASTVFAIIMILLR